MSYQGYFSCARACWNQRYVLAELKPRIQMVLKAVADPGSLNIFQYAQLMATALEFRPDLIVELGRGQGNSTCAFTEVANRLGNMKVLSLDQNRNWSATERRLRATEPKSWFQPLAAIETDILTFNFREALAGASRVLLFWDAHGFDVARIVLGGILPELANREHLVAMHDIYDLRYQAKENLSYGNDELWTGGNSTNSYLMIGNIASNVEQAVSVLDFSTRNGCPLHTADHSLHTELNEAETSELTNLWGDMFSSYGQWVYFSLRESAGPLTFPKLKAAEVRG
jgi:hypothetical protein